MSKIQLIRFRVEFFIKPDKLALFEIKLRETNTTRSDFFRESIENFLRRNNE